MKWILRSFIDLKRGQNPLHVKIYKIANTSLQIDWGQWPPYGRCLHLYALICAHNGLCDLNDLQRLEVNIEKITVTKQKRSNQDGDLTHSNHFISLYLAKIMYLEVIILWFRPQLTPYQEDKTDVRVADFHPIWQKF